MKEKLRNWKKSKRFDSIEGFNKLFLPKFLLHMMAWYRAKYILWIILFISQSNIRCQLILCTLCRWDHNQVWTKSVWDQRYTCRYCPRLDSKLYDTLAVGSTWMNKTQILASKELILYWRKSTWKQIILIQSRVTWECT